MVLYKDFKCSVSSAHFQEREHKFNPDFVVSGLKSLQEAVHMSMVFPLRYLGMLHVFSIPVWLNVTYDLELTQNAQV